jgi:hypothetical protein
MRKYVEFGPKWNKISRFFNDRSDNALRNRWQLMNRRQLRNAADGEMWHQGLPPIQCASPAQLTSAACGPGPSLDDTPIDMKLPDIIPIEKAPELTFGSLFDLSENVNSGANLFGEDPFDCWSGFNLF